MKKKALSLFLFTALFAPSVFAAAIYNCDIYDSRGTTLIRYISEGTYIDAIVSGQDVIKNNFPDTPNLAIKCVLAE